jgi:hypothetical protein
MTCSALLFGALGVIATFAPDVVTAGLGADSAPLMDVVVQLLGAAYLGLALMTWMSRHNVVGGIYGRPLVLCHLMHTVSGGLALGKALAASPVAVPSWAWGVAGSYVALALGFGVLMIRHPLAPPT